MKLIFEKSRKNRGLTLLPDCDVEKITPSQSFKRQSQLNLPEVSETELSRHYTALSKQVYGVNSGFYPLGSCTMKYNPKINEEMAALKEFTQIHPLQPKNSVQGCLEVLYLAEKYLCEITGMDAMTFQPAAGAHGEFTGLLLIKAYHISKGDTKRNKIIIPDSAHGTNPASAVMCGFEVINIPSKKDGCVDLKALQSVLGEDTAGLMLTNPNTVGIFDKNILLITQAVHDAGGLCYYDGANLNAVMGIVRPGDMGFDVVHLNLHKTFSTPHGGGGPGSGPVGCKQILAPYLPGPHIVSQKGKYDMMYPKQSIGRVKAFYGNFTVVIKALSYIMTLGKEGVPNAAQNAVLNANYLMKKLSGTYEMAYSGYCMHEFVMTLEALYNQTGASALDVAKGLLDRGIHPPTMYFPLIVKEALMAEPTETESKEMLEEAANIFIDVYNSCISSPDTIHSNPVNTPVRRLDEVTAARKPILKYTEK